MLRGRKRNDTEDDTAGRNYMTVTVGSQFSGRCINHSSDGCVSTKSCMLSCRSRCKQSALTAGPVRGEVTDQQRNQLLLQNPGNSVANKS